MKTNTDEATRARLEGAIVRAVNFLAHRQLPYGEFKTIAASDRLLKRNARFDSSPFITAWVADCLSYCHGPQVKAMTRRAVRYLQAEMEGSGLWRYWSSRNETHDYLPPDLDDTCCISALLRKLGQPVPRNREYILANRNKEGQFLTWMVPREDSPRRVAKALRPLIDQGARAVWSMQGILENVDPGVNANVLTYLGEGAETRAATGYLIDLVCEDRTPTSPSFYPDALTFHYLVSRAYASGVRAQGETRAAIVERVMAVQNSRGGFGNELMTAFGICTLLNFERCGSEELTTAMCVQALARHYQKVY